MGNWFPILTFLSLLAFLAPQTTGEVLPEGGDQKSREAKSLRNLRSDSQVDRAKQVGISRRQQQHLDKIARVRPDLHERVKLVSATV